MPFDMAVALDMSSLGAYLISHSFLGQLCGDTATVDIFKGGGIGQRSTIKSSPYPQ